MGKFNKLLTALQSEQIDEAELELQQSEPSFLISQASSKAAPDPASVQLTAQLAQPSSDGIPRRLISRDLIVRDPNQVRKYFDLEKLNNLAQTIAEEGVLEDLAVYELPDRAGYYQLVFGERRYRASGLAGLKEVPVRIIPKPDSKKLLKLQLIENKHHEDLNPIEEVEGALALLAAELEQPVEAIISLLKQMDNDIRRSSYNVMGQPAANAVMQTLEGLNIKWRSFVLNQLPLLGLSEDILEPIRQGKIEYTKALTIARLRDSDQRQELLQEAIGQNLSIRSIRERIKQLPKPEPSSAGTVSDEIFRYIKRFDTVNRQFKKSKILQDPQKRERVDTLLQELELLLEQ
jgi:ParB family transcriptional regulator, chromosome partitioning protein